MSLNTRRQAFKALNRQRGKISLGRSAQKEIDEQLERTYPRRPGVVGLLPRRLRRSIMAANGSLPRKKRMAHRGPNVLVRPAFVKGSPVKGMPVIDARLYQSPELKAAIADLEANRETTEGGRSRSVTTAKKRIVVPKLGDVLSSLKKD